MFGGECESSILHCCVHSEFIITTRILMNTDRFGFMQILLQKLLVHHLFSDREPISSHDIRTVLCGNSTNIIPTDKAASSKNFEITLPDSLKSKPVKCDQPRIRNNNAHVHYPPPSPRKMSDTFNQSTSYTWAKPVERR